MGGRSPLQLALAPAQLPQGGGDPGWGSHEHTGRLLLYWAPVFSSVKWKWTKGPKSLSLVWIVILEKDNGGGALPWHPCPETEKRNS